MAADVVIECRKLEGLSVASSQPASLAFAMAKQLLLFESGTSLTCHAVDDVECLLIGAVAEGGVALIRIAEPSSDIVALMSSFHECEAILSNVQQLRRLREARGAVLGKVCVCIHRELRSVTDLLCGDGVSCVKWRKGMSASFPPFPHSRLDFLRLHSNRSVTQKLSSYGDESIEMSFDQVEAGGSLIDRAVTQPPPTQSVASWCLPSEAFVVIVTERSLYITRQTGSLVCRLSFGELSFPKVVTEGDMKDSLIVVNDRGGWLVLRTRYARDVVQKIRTFTAAVMPFQSEVSRKKECDSVDKASQTELPSTVTPVEFAADHVWKQRYSEAVESVAERDAEIALLRKRIALLTDASTGRMKAGKPATRIEHENDILRHYAALLEERLEEHPTQPVVDPTKDSHQIDSIIEDLLGRDQRSKTMVAKLRTQVELVTRSFEKSLAEVSSKLTTSLRDWISAMERSTQKLISVSVPSKQVDLKQLRELNKQLIAELKEREAILDGITLNEGCHALLPTQFATLFQRREALQASVAELEAQVQGLAETLERTKTELIAATSELQTANMLSDGNKKLQSAFHNLVLQANRVANLEVLLVESTSRKYNHLLLEEKLKMAEKEVASLKLQLSSKRTKKQLVSKAPSPQLTSSPQSAFTPRKEENVVVSLSPPESSETKKLQHELELQRTAFEARLRDLEIVAFQATQSSDSMGVLHVSSAPNDTTRTIAALEAENILLRRPPSSKMDVFRARR